MKYTILSILLMIIVSAAAQPGTNDPTFNIQDDCASGNGAGFDYHVLCSALQADGKIVVGGKFNSFDGNPQFRIARLNPDGSMDNSFDIGSSGFDGDVKSINVQPDNKIIVGGMFDQYLGPTQNRLVRLNPDASVDPTFDIGTGFNFHVYSTVLQPDGKIIVAGAFTSFDGSAINRIIRLNADGSQDLSFNPGGGFNDDVRALCLQPDGKIIAAGDFSMYNDVVRNGIARLNANGSLDLSFNPGTGLNNQAHTAALQEDGKIIVGGEFTACQGQTYNKIVRLNSDGLVDPTFNCGSGFNFFTYCIAIQDDGKILVGGDYEVFNGNACNSIIRLNEDGTPDNTFSTGAGIDNRLYTFTIQPNGKIIAGGEFTTYNAIGSNNLVRIENNGMIDTSFNMQKGFNGTVYSLQVQSDGRIITGGNFTSFNSVGCNYIARLNADGSYDYSFTSGEGFDSTVRTLLIQPDQKIIVGGEFMSFNGVSRNRIARLNADGTLDTTFNPGTGFNGYVFSLALQPDGKIIVGGLFSTFNGTPRNHIARLNADGTFDATFVPTGGFNDFVTSVCVQPDGAVLAAGLFSSFNGTFRNRIARLNSDGSVDLSFNPGTGFNSYVTHITLQPDGKIIATGNFTIYNSNTRNRIARIQTNGTLDASFNPGPGFNDLTQTAILQEDGQIIVGGDFYSFNGVSRNNIARLNSNGTLDASFEPIAGANDEILTLGIQPGGKIIAGGNFISFDETCRFRIARINGDCGITTTANYFVVACDTFTLNGYHFTNTGTYTVATTNFLGCDSLITIDLIVGNTSYLQLNHCGTAYTINGQTYTSSGIYSQILTGTTGCDSTITIDLTLETPLNPSVSISGITLTAVELGANYQWLDCSNSYTEIPGATNSSFIPSVNGSYSVNISQSICSDTSACILVQDLETKENSVSSLVVYPNPATNSFSITGIPEDCIITIFNLSGESIQTVLNYNPKNTIDVSRLSAGIYLVKVDSAMATSAYLRLVVQ